MTDLTRPQRYKGTERITSLSFLFLHLRKSSTKACGECPIHTCLDLDFRHFQRTQSDIGEHLSGGRASEPDGRLVLVSSFLAGQVGVVVLEYFVETVFEHSLKGVADERGSEPFPDTIRAFLFDEEFEGGGEASVFLRVNLGISSVSQSENAISRLLDLPAYYILQHLAV
jgi:hypothetical protein